MFDCTKAIDGFAVKMKVYIESSGHTKVITLHSIPNHQQLTEIIVFIVKFANFLELKHLFEGNFSNLLSCKLLKSVSLEYRIFSHCLLDISSEFGMRSVVKVFNFLSYNGGTRSVISEGFYWTWLRNNLIFDEFYSLHACFKGFLSIKCVNEWF